MLQDVHHFSQRDALSLQFEPVLLPSSTTNFTKIASFTCKGTDFKNSGDCLLMFVIDGSSFCGSTWHCGEGSVLREWACSPYRSLHRAESRMEKMLVSATSILPHAEDFEFKE